MSYHGSVYCGWCCNKGHNKRGCPERKKHIRDHPDSYEASKQHAEEKRRTDRGPRKCTYCDTAGHNRKTCAPLKSDRQFITAHYKERRTIIAERLVEEGLGVGALVDARSRYDGDAMATVTGFDWKDLNGNLEGDMDPTITVSLLVQRFDERSVRWHHVNLDMAHRKYHPEVHEGANASVVASPLAPQDVRACFPAGWLDGTCYKEQRFFEKGQGRHYFFCNNNPQND